MIRKTFDNHSVTRKLHVEQQGDDFVCLEIETRSRAECFTLASDNIPALMLALAEAAGWPEEDPNSITHPIMKSLGDVVRVQERITAEAKEQAELEALALTLSNEYVTQLGFDSVESWDDSGELRKTAWVAVARKAREMRAEK